MRVEPRTSWKGILLLFPLLLLFEVTCSPGRGGGGGVSVGTSLTQIFFSLEPVTGQAAPTFPLLVQDDLLLPSSSSLRGSTPNPALGFQGAITSAILGIAEVRIWVGPSCNGSQRYEVREEGPFLLSLTDATIRPEIPPLPVTRGTLLCELRLKGNSGKPNRPEEGPPFLLIRGSFPDGRSFVVLSEEARDFRVESAPLPLSTSVKEIRLFFPYQTWLQPLDPNSFAEPTSVEISEVSHREVLETIVESLERTSQAKEGKGCDLPLDRTVGKKPEELCKEEGEEK